MKNMKTFESFLNEAKIGEYTDSDNTFYWSVTDSRLKYQIPSVLSRESEPISPAARKVAFSDDQDSRNLMKKIVDLVKKANDDMNKEFEAFEKKLAQIGEKAAKDVNKMLEKT